MAKGDNNVILNHLSGSIGNQITIRQRSGTTVVSKKQKKSTKRRSEKQIATNEAFREASKRAEFLLKDPDMLELYNAAAKPPQNGYNLAVSDAYRPPEIKHVYTDQYTGKTGQTILIRAYDVFRVFRVTVAIYDIHGVVIEEGNALINRNCKDWTYTATKENDDFKGGRIVVMAEDIPGNQTYGEIVV